MKIITALQLMSYKLRFSFVRPWAEKILWRPTVICGIWGISEVANLDGCLGVYKDMSCSNDGWSSLLYTGNHVETTERKANHLHFQPNVTLASLVGSFCKPFWVVFPWICKHSQFTTSNTDHFSAKNTAVSATLRSLKFQWFVSWKNWSKQNSEKRREHEC